MSSKVATSGHTAGIFADMSLDGPDIGVLVAVIDRARNLPNRRTMGKQDPYCAMRLGKEAKKTGTDRRGGQTPKWDQELRFTVHESPDYYKLKCSVFNDDKKTDLIGESWVDLREVVVPGGGQNDLWHQLNFKGKYAGEIRMELTYYDTRPKDETVVERRREKTRRNSQSTTTSTEITGSRQLGPREIRRRPLPPSPIGSSPFQNPAGTSSTQNPLREPPYQNQQPVQAQKEDIMPRRRPPAAQYEVDRSEHQNSESHQFQHYSEHLQSREARQQPKDHSYEVLQPYEELAPPEDYSHLKHPTFVTPPLQSQHVPQPLLQTWEDEQSFSSSDVVELSQRWSSPSSISPNVQPTDPRTTSAFQRFGTSPVKNIPFRDSPLRQLVSHHDVADEPGYASNTSPPPPPPAHRQGPATNSSVSYGSPNAARVTFPVSPLNARNSLQAIERGYDPYHTPPATQQPQEARSNPLHFYNNLTDQFRHSTGSFIINDNRSQEPPRKRGSYDPMDGYDDPRAFEEDSQEDSDGLQHMRGSYDHNMPHPQPQSFVPDERRVYTSSPTLFRPRAVSPNALRHSIPRRSTSPNPSAGGRESLGSMPFGPDAYEVINPQRSSPAPNQGQSQVEAREEVETARELGPIIGNDGREIDPSDHLPSDTWAPEPERKNRKPEVVIRFKTKDEMRRTPASSPAAARPQSYSGHANSPTSMHTESPSPRTGRNRLQKQAPSRPLPAQPFQHANSSPVVPQKITPTRPPPTQVFQHPHSSPLVPSVRPHQIYATTSRQAPFRPSLSEYSLNNIEVHSSPHQSPYDNITLPPVPAKVPLDGQDWGRGDYPRTGSYDSLSAELSSIDIGPSRGGRTGLRSSRGYGY